MKYLSVCSGIEAATAAWHGFGWDPVGFSEIEPFPSAVLAHHYPEVPNLGDMTKFKEWKLNAFDILVGGTPCQAFSVAGMRQSLDDARGNLSLVFCEMADHFDPGFIVWENVPGVLNTKDNAFGCFLAGLAGEDVPLIAPGGKWSNAGCVVGPKRKLAWRILDAQYFGLAQRRRRVFVVACPRDGADPCEILFEREGVQRHSAPSREKGEGFAGVAGTLSANRGGLDRPAGNANELDFCVPVAGSRWEGGAHPSLSQSLRSSGGIGMSNQELFIQKGAGLVPAVMAHGQGNAEIVSDGDPSLTCNHEAPIAFHPTQDPIHSADGSCHALGCGSGKGQATHAVAFAQNQLGEVRTGEVANTLNTNFNASGRNTPCVCFGGDVARTLQARHDSSPCADRGMDVVAIGWSEELTASEELAGTIQRGGDGGRHEGVMTPAMQVRRLTPVECERLQGFPDGYTAIPWRKKPASECPDGPRYKALGNSMAVPVMRWIGQRILLTCNRRSFSTMEKIINLFERLVVALEKIASAHTNLMNTAGTSATETQAAPEAKAKKGKGKKEEAAATSHAVPSIDPQGDDFGGPDPAAAAAEEDEFGGAEEQAATATRDEALAAIRDLALRKGRDTAATLLKQVSGCEKTSEIEKMPNAAQIFGAIVVSAAKLV